MPHIVYHVSPTPGLKVLTPRVSTHGKPWVYAIESLAIGLLFGVRKDDFDFLITTEPGEPPTVYECYPGALQRVYQGKRCTVYELSGETFQRGMTTWSPELVSEEEVPVLREIPVPDLYQRLLDEEARGSLRLCRYSSEADYRKRIAEHVVDRMVRFELDPASLTRTDPRFATHFKSLAEGLQALTDGHLLET